MLCDCNSHYAVVLVWEWLAFSQRSGDRRALRVGEGLPVEVSPCLGRSNL